MYDVCAGDCLLGRSRSDFGCDRRLHRHAASLLRGPPASAQIRSHGALYFFGAAAPFLRLNRIKISGIRLLLAPVECLERALRKPLSMLMAPDLSARCRPPSPVACRRHARLFLSRQSPRTSHGGVRPCRSKLAAGDIAAVGIKQHSDNTSDAGVSMWSQAPRPT